MKLVTLMTVTCLLMASAAQAATSVTTKINRAVWAMEDLMSSDETSIPRDLMDAAQCIVSMKVYQGGFVFGAKGGEGVASCRGQDGVWGAPVFIDLGGGSIGFQIGVEKVDLTLVYTNRNAVSAIVQENFTLGGNVGLSAGPVGRNLSAGTNYSLDDKIYSYSRSQGLYAGASIEGAYTFIRDNYNRAVYGSKTPHQILNLQGSEIPAIVAPFVSVLEKYSR